MLFLQYFGPAFVVFFMMGGYPLLGMVRGQRGRGHEEMGFLVFRQKLLELSFLRISLRFKGYVGFQRSGLNRKLAPSF